MPVRRLGCPLRAETVPAVRAEVHAYARSAGLVDPQLYRFVMAVNELVTNAVRHAGGAGRLELWHDGRVLHCRVSDNGPGIPADRLGPASRPEPGTIGGWGLWLVREVCARVDIGTGRSGSLASIEFPLPPA